MSEASRYLKVEDGQFVAGVRAAVQQGNAHAWTRTYVPISPKILPLSCLPFSIPWGKTEPGPREVKRRISLFLCTESLKSVSVHPYLFFFF